MSNQNIVYIKLIAEYDRTELTANTVLYWGGDTSDLQEIKSKGYFFEIDQVFNVIVADDPIFYQSFVHYTPVYSLSAATIAEVHIKSAVTAKFILQELDCDDAILNVLSQVAKQSRKSSLQKVSNNNGQKCTDIQLQPSGAHSVCKSIRALPTSFSKGRTRAAPVFSCSRTIWSFFQSIWLKRRLKISLSRSPRLLFYL